MCQCVCWWVCARASVKWGRATVEGNSLSLHAIQSVKAPSTHLYDNFLFTMSKDSNTDTIHFPLLTGAGMLRSLEVTCGVF